MAKLRFLYYLLLVSFFASAQQEGSVIDSFRISGDVKIAIDYPPHWQKSHATIITFFALPNGNTTAQTMGKKMMPGDDWHFDIQHIRAQTAFIREELPNKNFVVVYLENNYKSWPAWKQKHPDFAQLIPAMIDSITGLVPGHHKSIYLNGHSGGGSFVFGYLAGVSKIPSNIKRISFLDSDYGYDSSYYPKFKQWLSNIKGAELSVFAYNDSVALYNGKLLVSPTGGTWWRSHLMLQHLEQDMTFSQTNTDSLIIFKSNNKRVQFFFKLNTDRGIYHTQQVELNGFIHSVLCGTKADSKNYQYYGTRAYSRFIE